MNLNTVLMFGDLLDWNSALSLSLMIIGLLLLAIAIFGLIVWLVKLSRREPVEKLEKTERVRTERIVVKQSAQPRVVVVQQPAEPQVVVVQQQAAPEVIVEPQPVEQPLTVIRPQTQTPMAQEFTEPIAPPAPYQPAFMPTSEEDGEDDDEEIIEESVEGGVIRYNRSFMAKYIQSSDEAKTYYVHLKNEVLSYLKVRGRISWRRETFRFGKSTALRMSMRGKTLCLYFPLDPTSLAGSKYDVENVSDTALYADTPCMYRIISEKREKYARELIALVMESLGAVKTERIYEDYYLPYEGIVQLIDKGLVKRVLRRNDKSYISTN